MRTQFHLYVKIFVSPGPRKQDELCEPLRRDDRIFDPFQPVATRALRAFEFRLQIKPCDSIPRQLKKKTETHSKTYDVPERSGSNLIEKPLYILKPFFGLQRIFLLGQR